MLNEEVNVMTEYFEKQTLRLDAFKLYLIKDSKLSEITARDYVKRIVSICNEEKIILDDLVENIEHYAYEYSDGSKIELGKRSHNSYRSAIKHFYNFIKNAGGTISANPNIKPKYNFEIYKIPGEHFGIIKLIDLETNQVIDTETSISREHHSATEVHRDISLKCLDMVFRTIYANDNSKLDDILSSLGISLTIDGNKIII